VIATVVGFVSGMGAFFATAYVVAESPSLKDSTFGLGLVMASFSAATLGSIAIVGRAMGGGASNQRETIAAPDPTALFIETCAAIRAQAPARSRASSLTVLALSLIAFLLVARTWWSPTGVALLILVLLIHETGHLVAMRTFGYRNLGIFFIPLFGAVATGKKEGAPAWQEGLVLLAGPLPGLFLACALMGFGVARGAGLQLAAMLAVINALNLIPLEPLDGGRLMNLLLFSRRGWLEGVFVVVAGMALALIALRLHSIAFGFLAFVELTTAPMRFRFSTVARELSAQALDLPTRLADTELRVLRILFDGARRIAPRSLTARSSAAVMARLHERLLLRPASVGTTVGLLAAYGTGLALSAAALVVIAILRSHGHA
jgi:Zn-dependent protease